MVEALEEAAPVPWLEASTNHKESQAEQSEQVEEAETEEPEPPETEAVSE